MRHPRSFKIEKDSISSKTPSTDKIANNGMSVKFTPQPFGIEATLEPD